MLLLQWCLWRIVFCAKRCILLTVIDSSSFSSVEANYRLHLGEYVVCDDRWIRISPFSLTRWSGSISTMDTGTTGPSWRWRRYTTRSICRAWTPLQAVLPSTRACYDTSTSLHSASPARMLYTPSTAAFSLSIWLWQRFRLLVVARRFLSFSSLEPTNNILYL